MPFIFCKAARASRKTGKAIFLKKKIKKVKEKKKTKN
jgi:hypothetical protein